MPGADRVALVGFAWFLGWIGVGYFVGKSFDMPGTGEVTGFILAFVTVFFWPVVLPRFIDDWMHDPSA